MIEEFPVHVDAVAVVPDLFFASRIRSLAAQHGRAVAIARSIDELEQLLATHRTRLVLVDLGARGVDTREVIRIARDANVELIVAFGPHKDLAARADALAAGADRWVANQRLLETLTGLLASGGSNRG